MPQEHPMPMVREHRFTDRPNILNRIERMRMDFMDFIQDVMKVLPADHREDDLYRTIDAFRIMSRHPILGFPKGFNQLSRIMFADDPNHDHSY